MPRPKRPYRVAVVFDWNAAAARPMLAGVVRFARGKPWDLIDNPKEADGVIAMLGLAVTMNLPIVRVTATPGPADIAPDAAAVGRMAAEHFLQRGFRHFGRLGEVDDAFDDAIAAAGLAPPVRLTAADSLETLARPFACFAATDAEAAAVLRSARTAGRAVPDDLAVLGVGDDPPLCELADPPLSSLDVGMATLGFRAAGRLERLRHGRPTGPPERLPPVGVVTRVSTDTLAIADEEVAAAVRFIREQAGGPLRVGDVLRAVGLDRRTLERRFRKSLGRSPAEVLRRRRIDHAARLLRTTDRSVADVARACGFRLPQHLAAGFRAVVGQTPSDYRASVRGEVGELER